MMCAHFVELPLCLGRIRMLQLEIELDHLGSTGDHWETLSGSYPIWKWVRGSNQYLSNFSSSPWYNFSEDMFYLSLVICDVRVFSN